MYQGTARLCHTVAPTISVLSLGCKLNQAEAEDLALSLIETGYRVRSDEAPADGYVINTCSVTHVADQKSRQLVRRLRRLSPQAKIVVAGCYAERLPRDVEAAAHVDAIVSNERKSDLLSVVGSLVPITCWQSVLQGKPPGRSSLGRARALVKVGDGCDKFCSYCIVPYTRGRERSETLDSVVAAVQERADSGCQEVVLTAVNLGRWGMDQAPGRRLELPGLVRQVLERTSIHRLRLSSIEPEDFQDGLIPLLRSGRVCRHLHLPLQSGCDSVLRRMRRRYDLSSYASLVERVRQSIPDLAVTTDVMVGFPGETDQEFDQTCRFVEAMDFAGVHVFKYSPRAGTVAAGMSGQVAAAVKAERWLRLSQLAAKSAHRFRRRYVGRELEVLYESPVDDCGDAPTSQNRLWKGLTDNYLRVYSPGRTDQTARVMLTRVVGDHGDGLLGQSPGGPEL